MSARSKSPHIRSYTGDIKDYNGAGEWSVQAVQARYRSYCEQLGIEDVPLLEPRLHKAEGKVWISPIMAEVIQGIDRGDKACIALGVDFVLELHHFAFGRKLKSSAARSLRRSPLTQEQQERLRDHVVTMLVSGIIPHEMREYNKLLRTIGVGEHWQRLDRDIPKDNPFAMRFYRILREAAGFQSA